MPGQSLPLVLRHQTTDREFIRRENTALRAQLDPHLISVVPNAIVPETFEANPEEADPNHSKLVPHIMLRKIWPKLWPNFYVMEDVV